MDIFDKKGSPVVRRGFGEKAVTLPTKGAEFPNDPWFQGSTLEVISSTGRDLPGPFLSEILSRKGGDLGGHAGLMGLSQQAPTDSYWKKKLEGRYAVSSGSLGESSAGQALLQRGIGAACPGKDGRNNRGERFPGGIIGLSSEGTGLRGKKQQTEEEKGNEERPPSL